jgi:hypothetical protein
MLTTSKAFGIALGLGLLASVAARADVITAFDVSGAATNESGGSLDSCAAGATCSFSGTLGVDVTNGTVTAVDITFPGLSAVNTLESFGVDSGDVFIFAGNSSGDVMSLDFTTTPTPGSLVGFDGGIIVGSGIEDVAAQVIQYSSFSGSVTPAAVPEPASLTLFGTALLGFGVIHRRRRNRV